MKLSRRKIIFGLISLWFLALPVMALAQASQTAQPAAGQGAAVQPTAGAGANGQNTAGQSSNSQSVPGEAKNAAENIDVKLQVPLPFVKMTNGKVSNLKDYIEGIYKFLIGAGALLAVVMFIVAGYEWMISGGSADKTGSAKKRMWAAAMGLVLALLSFVILQTINEKLVKLELPKIDPVQRIEIGQAGDNCFDTKSFNDWDAAHPDSQDLYLRDKYLVQNNKPAPDLSRNLGRCGSNYLVYYKDNTRKETLFGECGGNLCGLPGDKANFICIANRCSDGSVYGHVKWSDTGTLLSAGYLNEIYLLKICGAPIGYSAKIMSSNKFSGKPDSYIIPTPKDPIDDTCGPISTFYGYGLLVGIKGTLGDALTSISRDLRPTFYKLVGSDCSQAYTPAPNIVVNTAGNYELSVHIRGDLSADHLIKMEQLATGLNCNLDLTNPSFK